MVWSVGGITLPIVNKVKLIDGANTEEVDVDSELPVIVCPDLEPRQLTIGGSIYEISKSKADLLSDYLSGLRALKGTEVAVVSPYGVYDGDWMLVLFESEETAEGANARFKYSIKLKQGSSHVTL